MKLVTTWFGTFIVDNDARVMEKSLFPNDIEELAKRHREDWAEFRSRYIDSPWYKVLHELGGDEFQKLARGVKTVADVLRDLQDSEREVHGLPRLSTPTAETQKAQREDDNLEEDFTENDLAALADMAKREAG